MASGTKKSIESAVKKSYESITKSRDDHAKNHMDYNRRSRRNRDDWEDEEDDMRPSKPRFNPLAVKKEEPVVATPVIKTGRVTIAHYKKEEK